MAQPKTKTTKSKRNNRRSHHGAVAQSFVKCANCGEEKLAHSVCDKCGFYKGKAVVDKKEI